jgi:hypothetical protein
MQVAGSVTVLAACSAGYCSSDGVSAESGVFYGDIGLEFLS